MIQAMLGDECLGTFFQNGSAKLYFNSGLRKEINIKLENLLTGNAFTWSWETQTRENWHLAWQEHFKPVVIDNKLAVIPHWENDKPAEITIRIKPGMAFGTGHHETTWLMLSQMLKYLKPGMSVLDLGTGSGILSIAAKKMGAGKVDSVEHDPDCEPNFYENLQLNKIIDGIQFHHGDVLSWIKLDYDLIMANINRNVIEDLLPELKEINTFIEDNNPFGIKIDDALGALINRQTHSDLNTFVRQFKRSDDEVIQMIHTCFSSILTDTLLESLNPKIEISVVV